MSRVRLLTPEDIPDEHRSFFDGLDERGAFINLYRAMAHSPAALRRLYELLVTLYAGALTPRIREIAILSVVSASDARYPLGWHLLDAQEAGLTADEIQAVVRDHADALPVRSEAAVARLARELTMDACVSDAALRAVEEFMDERQIVELTMLVGLYRLVACAAAALSVDLDEEPARALALAQMTDLRSR